MFYALSMKKQEIHLEDGGFWAYSIAALMDLSRLFERAELDFCVS